MRQQDVVCACGSLQAIRNFTQRMKGLQRDNDARSTLQAGSLCSNPGYDWDWDREQVRVRANPTDPTKQQLPD